MGSECVFCFWLGSVNEWMRRKKKWMGGGRGVYVGWEGALKVDGNRFTAND